MLSAVNLLVKASLDQLLLIMKKIIYFFTKQAILMRRSSPSVSIPCGIDILFLPLIQKMYQFQGDQMIWK
jgi:hypothetical protein